MSPLFALAVDVNSGNILLVLVLVGLALAVWLTIVTRYKRCPSNKILVIYGKTDKGAAKCIHGGAKFVVPLIQSYDFLDLEPFVIPIDLSNALSQENIRVTVPTTVTAAISNQPGIMENAAIRLLGLSPQQIQNQAQDIILGQMRAVLATMRIDDINRDRQSFMQKVNEAVAVELEKIGLAVINVNIRDIEDESGYIKALGRKAAAEAINQANVDVAEQEKTGQTGVAQRNRDQRVAVAAAEAEAEIGEAAANRTKRQQVAATVADAEIGEAEAARKKRQQVAAANAAAQIGEASADRDKRQETAKFDAEAVQAETNANASKAAFRANQKVAEEEARQKGESVGKEADGGIRVAQENAQKRAEDARALREASRLNAEVVVPAEAAKKKLIIEADAQREQAVLIATGQAQAVLARMTAEAKGTQAVLEGKAAGYRALVQSAGDPQTAAALLLIERLTEIANIQAKAIQDLPIEKIVIWDGGGEGGGMSGLGKKIMGALPPMHELAKQVGLELPEFLGRIHSGEDTAAKAVAAAAAKADAPATPPPLKK